MCIKGQVYDAKVQALSYKKSHMPNIANHVFRHLKKYLQKLLAENIFFAFIQLSKKCPALSPGIIFV